MSFESWLYYRKEKIEHKIYMREQEKFRKECTHPSWYRKFSRGKDRQYLLETCGNSRGSFYCGNLLNKYKLVEES